MGGLAPDSKAALCGAGRDARHLFYEVSFTHGPLDAVGDPGRSSVTDGARHAPADGGAVRALIEGDEQSIGLFLDLVRGAKQLFTLCRQPLQGEAQAPVGREEAESGAGHTRRRRAPQGTGRRFARVPEQIVRRARIKGPVNLGDELHPVQERYGQHVGRGRRGIDIHFEPCPAQQGDEAAAAKGPAHLVHQDGQHHKRNELFFHEPPHYNAIWPGSKIGRAVV